MDKRSLLTLFLPFLVSSFWMTPARTTAAPAIESRRMGWRQGKADRAHNKVQSKVHDQGTAFVPPAAAMLANRVVSDIVTMQKVLSELLNIL